MAGYTNSFTKVNGELIDAPTFQQEYTALGDAFDATAGHKHDGTAAEGPLIALIGASANEVLCDSVGDQIVFSVNVAATKTAQVSIADGAILPDTTNDIDLGSALLKFKDAHVEGNVNAGNANLTTLEVSGVASLDGGIDVDESGSVFSVNGISGNTLISGSLGAGATTLSSLTFATGTTVTSVIDDDTMAGDSDVALVTQGNVVAYVATEIAASTLDGGSF